MGVTQSGGLRCGVWVAHGSNTPRSFTETQRNFFTRQMRGSSWCGVCTPRAQFLS